MLNAKRFDFYKRCFFSFVMEERFTSIR